MRNNTSEIVFKGIAEFILYRKDLVIQFLNKNGYAELSNDAPVDEVNKAVANNMLDENFIAEFLLFQRDVEEGRYCHRIRQGTNRYDIDKRYGRGESKNYQQPSYFWCCSSRSIINSLYFKEKK